MTPAQITEIRLSLGRLPIASHHPPGQSVDDNDVYTVFSHKSALQPERTLVVGNRGMGKSFWAHALLNDIVRERVARELQIPALAKVTVRFGFNGSAALDPVAPTPEMLAGLDPILVWRTVMARALADQCDTVLPTGFSEQVKWVGDNPEAYAALLTQSDQRFGAQGTGLLVLFDALDRLGRDWTSMRERLQGLLRFALEVQSFRHLRIKLFLRFDQFADPRLFEFPDAAKLRNSAVDLAWPIDDLCGLLFFRMRVCDAFETFAKALPLGEAPRTRTLIEALAGKFMGTGKKRGHVYTWLPTHLADAHGHISPRTFLTVWRGAATHGETPANTPVDYPGIHEGVRLASRARLAELSEDYPWVRIALESLRDREVPMPREMLEALWREEGTFAKVVSMASAEDRYILIPVQLQMFGAPSSEEELLRALEMIGVVNVRATVRTVDVPDIFRVEARIKRRGGVKPGRRPGS